MIITAKAKKLPSGSWRVQAKAGGQVKSFTGPDRKIVEAEAKAWQAGLVPTSDNADITVFEAYNRYITSKEKVLSPSTIRNYKKMYNNNFQSIMNVRIDRLTEEQIQRAVNELSVQHSPKTVKNNYGLLTAVLGMFRPKFTPNIHLPQKEKKEIYIPTKSELKTLLEKSKGTGYYLPILLAATCGMRAGEICALTSDDIHGDKINVNKSLVCDENGQWLIKQPKSYAGYRNIDMPEAVKNEIKNIDGKIVKYNPHSLSTGFRKLLKNNGLTLFNFHALRHFYVSELFDMGLPEKYIIAQVGHSSASITKAVYDHLSAEKQGKYAADIAKHFSILN